MAMEIVAGVFADLAELKLLKRDKKPAHAVMKKKQNFLTQIRFKIGRSRQL